MIAGRVQCTHCGVEVEAGAFRCQSCGNAAPRAASAAPAAPKTVAPDGKLAQRRAAKAAAKAAAGEFKAEGAGEGAFEPAGLSEKRFRGMFAKELSQRERGGGKQAKHQGKATKSEVDRLAGGHQVSKKSLECEHVWSSSGAAGVRCQVCNFETKKNSHTCKKSCGAPCTLSVRFCDSFFFSFAILRYCCS